MLFYFLTPKQWNLPFSPHFVYVPSISVHPSFILYSHLQGLHFWSLFIVKLLRFLASHNTVCLRYRDVTFILSLCGRAFTNNFMCIISHEPHNNNSIGKKQAWWGKVTCLADMVWSQACDLYIIPWLLLPKFGGMVMSHRKVAEITVNISEYKRKRMHEPPAMCQTPC